MCRGQSDFSRTSLAALGYHCLPLSSNHLVDDNREFEVFFLSWVEDSVTFEGTSFIAHSHH